MPNFEYHTEPLDEMEDVLGVFYGGRGQVGQQYVVTNRRLLMGPLDTGIAQDIDAYVLNQAVPGGGDLVKNVLSHYAPMNPTTLWLRHVVDVHPTNNARWFKAPGLQITTDTEQVFDLGVVATPKTMSRSPKNNDVRDRAVEVIEVAVAAAKVTPANGGCELPHFAEPQYHVAFAPDGRHLWTANMHDVCRWDLETGEKVAQEYAAVPWLMASAANADLVAVIESLRDQIVVRDHDARPIASWTLPESAALAEGVPTGVTSRDKLELSDDGSRLLFSAGGVAPRIWVWSVPDGEPLASVEAPSEQGPLTAATFVGNGKVATSSAGGLLCFWDIQAGTLVDRCDCPTAAQALIALGDRLLVAGNTHETAWEWDLGSRALRKLTLQTRERDPATRFALARDGSSLAAAYNSPKVSLWNLANGQESLLKGHHAPAQALAFDRTGRQLASAGQDGRINVWDTTSGKLVHALDDPSSTASAVAPTGDGRAVAAGRDGRIYVIHLSPGAPPPSEPAATVPAILLWVWIHQANGLAYLRAAGGTTYVFSIRDRAVRRLEAPKVLAVDADRTRALVSIPDGDRSQDRLAIWDLANDRELRSLGRRPGWTSIHAAAFANDDIVLVGNNVLARRGNNGPAQRELCIVKPGSQLEEPNARQIDSNMWLSPDGQHALTGTGLPETRRVVFTIPKFSKILSREGARDFTWLAGSRLATIEKARIEIWDLTSRARERTLELPPDQQPTRIDGFGDELLCQTANKRLHAWHLPV